MVVVLGSGCPALTIQPDHNTRVVLESGSAAVWAIEFHPDGMHLFDGTGNGIRRWRIADRQEVGNQTGMFVNPVSVSMDHKWVVCGTHKGASVWDAELRAKVVAVEGTEDVRAVDIAPDCTRFATGTTRGKASIWSITTGESLVGLPQHRGVAGIKFSPDGGRIATCGVADSTIKIFDSRNGDQLISIENPIPGNSMTTPFVWSTDSQRLFAISTGNIIKSFDSSSGSQLSEWQIHENVHGDRMSIALSADNKFIASGAGHFVSFWDTSTHTQLGIVEESHKIQSIALSPDGTRLAIGGYVGSDSIIIWNLSGILPDSYLPINVSTAFLTSRIALIINLCFLAPCSIGI